MKLFWVFPQKAQNIPNVAKFIINIRTWLGFLRDSKDFQNRSAKPGKTASRQNCTELHRYFHWKQMDSFLDTLSGNRATLCG